MTISESIKEWLQQYDKLDFSELLTDFIDVPEGTLSLYKTPNQTVIPYIDGSKQYTEYYDFFARKSSQLNEERVENQEILEAFCEWIEEMEIEECYPALDEGMTCVEVGIQQGASITSQEDDNAIYQITISITYVKER